MSISIAPSADGLSADIQIGGVTKATIDNTGKVTATSFAGDGNAVLPAQTGNSGKSLVTNGTAASWGSSIVSGSSIATTSGVAIDFTSIPSWAKRITVMLNGVSSNSTGNLLVELGSGSVQTTGYASASNLITSAVNAAIGSTAGFIISSAGAAYATTGAFVIDLMSGNTYVAHGSFYNNLTATQTVGGSVTLSGVLDRVRLLTTTGETFDAGSVNVSWE